MSVEFSLMKEMQTKFPDQGLAFGENTITLPKGIVLGNIGLKALVPKNVAKENQDAILNRIRSVIAKGPMVLTLKTGEKTSKQYFTAEDSQGKKSLFKFVYKEQSKERLDTATPPSTPTPPAISAPPSTPTPSTLTPVSQADKAQPTEGGKTQKGCFSRFFSSLWNCLLALFCCKFGQSKSS